MESRARPLSLLIARWHRAVGRVRRLLGHTAAARRSYERAAACGDDAFAVHLAIAQLAFAMGDYAAWRRGLDRARAVAPERYARLVDPARGTGPRLAGTAVTGPRPAVEAGARAGADDGRPAELGGIEFLDVQGQDDFSSPAERRRFEQLQPIEAQDVARCDFDELARRLSS